MQITRAAFETVDENCFLEALLACCAYLFDFNTNIHAANFICRVNFGDNFHIRMWIISNCEPMNQLTVCGSMWRVGGGKIINCFEQTRFALRVAPNEDEGTRR